MCETNPKTQPDRWVITKTIVGDRVEYRFGTHNSTDDMLAIQNALLHSLNAAIIAKVQGPYSVLTEYAVRGIVITLVDDSEYEIYFFTPSQNEQIASKAASDLESILNNDVK